MLPLPIGFVWNAGELRGGPGLEYPQIGQVAVGDIVELLDKYKEWWWVRTGSGDGWMEAGRLIIDGEASTPISADSAGDTSSNPANVPPGLVTLAGVVRAGPSSDYPAIVSVEPGTTIEILGKNGDWWQVWIKPNVGWINAALLMAATDPAAAPAPRAAVVAPAKSAPSVAKPQPVAPLVLTKQIPAAPAKPAPAAPAKAVAPAAVAPVPAKPAAPIAAAPAESLWHVNAAPGTLVQLPAVTAPNPQLAAEVVKPFLRARTRVLQSSGVDYLGHLDEALRAVHFESSKPGVASKSWHKAGRAVDLAVSYRVGKFEGVVFMRDAANPRYYRVLIRTTRQDGSLGEWYGPKRLPRGRQPAFYVDVTTIMLSEGFQRIPPWGDVSEAWHYEMRGNHTWASAMRQLYGIRTLSRIYPDVWR